MTQQFSVVLMKSIIFMLNYCSYVVGSVRINDLNKRGGGGVNCLRKVFLQILAKNED